MKTMDKALGVQLKALLQDITLEEACAALNLDVNSALIYLEQTNSAKSLDADELRRQYKAEMVQVLYNIASDLSIENTSARVAAAKALLDGDSDLPEFSVDKVSEMFKKMKAVCEATDIPAETITNPSPSTTIVDIKIPLVTPNLPKQPKKLTVEDMQNASN